MPDQAQGLRALVDQARHDIDLAIEPTAVVSPRHAARTIAVTSGKGGVGKTNFSSNLSILLAQAGQRVVVLDADLGLANMHILLGVQPLFTLEHVLREEMTLRDILVTGPAGVRIIAGASGVAEVANLDEERRTRFIESLTELEDLADVIIVDTGAGLSHNVMAFLIAVDEVIVVVTPEPTSIADAYATIKVVSRENPCARIRIVVNMAGDAREGQDASDKLRLVTKRFLGIDLETLGYVPRDPAVLAAVRAQSPVTIGSPESPAARAFRDIAANLGFESYKPAGAAGFLRRLSHYLRPGR